MERATSDGAGNGGRSVLEGRTSLIAAAALVLLAHSAGAVEDTVDSFRDWRIEFYAFGEGLAVGALLGGKPKLLRTERNRHDSTQDRVELVTWSGMELTVRRASDNQIPPLLERLSVKRRGILFPHNLEIGQSTPRDIEDMFGQPHRRTQSRYTYDGFAESCADSFSFHFHQNHLTMAEWEWCSD
jgi:hypothetical protein